MKQFILSDGSYVNSKGFKVSINGIRMDRFSLNPVMLKEHDPERVIGRWENPTKENNQLKATPVFDLKDSLGAETARKVEDNFLRASSIGIIPMKLEYINDEYVMTESELVEASIVSIPSDAGAVVLYNEKLEQLSFDQVKLNFNQNNNQTKQTMEKLSQKTMESLELTADYTPKEVELAVAEKDREILALKEDLAKKNKKAIEVYLNGAIKAGKIREAEKASFLKLAEKDFDSVKSIIDTKPEDAGVKLADMVSNTTLATSRKDWDYLKWMKDDPKGLLKLKYDNPKEFESLQTTYNK